MLELLKTSIRSGWRVITMRIESGEEGKTVRRSHKHSLRNGRNGDTPIGYSWRAALTREQCGIFAQNKNCGARRTAVCSEWLWNDICFLATEQCLLLGSRFLISNNWKAREEQCFLCNPCPAIITRTVWGNPLVVIVFSWKCGCEEKTRRTFWKLCKQSFLL
jgi:hypothetical protein